MNTHNSLIAPMTHSSFGLLGGVSSLFLASSLTLGCSERQAVGEGPPVKTEGDTIQLTDPIPAPCEHIDVLRVEQVTGEIYGLCRFKTAPATYSAHLFTWRPEDGRHISSFPLEGTPAAKAHQDVALMHAPNGNVFYYLGSSNPFHPTPDTATPIVRFDPVAETFDAIPLQFELEPLFDPEEPAIPHYLWANTRILGGADSLMMMAINVYPYDGIPGNDGIWLGRGALASLRVTNGGGLQILDSVRSLGCAEAVGWGADHSLFVGTSAYCSNQLPDISRILLHKTRIDESGKIQNIGFSDSQGVWSYPSPPLWAWEANAEREYYFPNRMLQITSDGDAVIPSWLYLYGSPDGTPDLMMLTAFNYDTGKAHSISVGVNRRDSAHCIEGSLALYASTAYGTSTTGYIADLDGVRRILLGDDFWRANSGDYISQWPYPSLPTEINLSDYGTSGDVEWGCGTGAGLVFAPAAGALFLVSMEGIFEIPLDD